MTRLQAYDMHLSQPFLIASVIYGSVDAPHDIEPCLLPDDVQCLRREQRLVPCERALVLINIHRARGQVCRGDVQEVRLQLELVILLAQCSVFCNCSTLSECEMVISPCKTFVTHIVVAGVEEAADTGGVAGEAFPLVEFCPCLASPLSSRCAKFGPMPLRSAGLTCTFDKAAESDAPKS